MTAASAIAQILDARVSAIRRGDLDALLADVADDVVVFDVVAPLRRIGSDAVRARTAEWLASYEPGIVWEDRDRVITADGAVAFCSMLSHVSGALKTGTRVDMWFRKTLGFQRRGDRWRITHDHGSVPFAPETGKASLSLEP